MKTAVRYLLTWTFLILTTHTIAQSSDQPASSGSPANIEAYALVQRDLGRLETLIKGNTEKIDKVATKQEETDKNVQEAKNNLFVVAALIAAGIAAVVAYARKYIKDKLDLVVKRSEDDLGKIQEEKMIELKEKLEIRLRDADLIIERQIESAVLETEKKAFRYIQIATLSYAQKYDEALAVVGWNGEFSQFLSYPEAIQRHLITCLTNAYKVRENRDHLKAWAWVKLLIENNPDAQNAETMLRIAKVLRHSDEAVKIYDGIAGNLTTDDQVDCEQFLIVILRKMTSDSEMKRRLIQLAEKHRHARDIRSQTTIAAVYRDEGLFEDADSIMRAAVQGLTGFAPRQEGWDKLFNTYIANCIDLGRALDAVPQAKTLLANFRGPDHVFNCARVAWRLPADLPARGELFSLIRRRFDDGLMPERDDGTVKTLALLRELDGQLDAAESVLRQSIDSMASKADNSPWVREELYFYKCFLAELLLGRKDDKALEQAIETLSEIAFTDKNGEASYLLAQATMRKKDSGEAVSRNLKRAASIKRKWIMKAKREDIFSPFLELNSLVGQYTAPLAAALGK